MKPPRFDYFRPATLEDVLELVNRFRQDARVIAGGQSLIPMMNLRVARPKVLIDLAGVAGLSGVAVHRSGLRIGAMTRQSELLTNPDVRKNVPLLAHAAGHIGHFQTRSRGTVGGSLANADPSAELSLVAVTLGARLTLQSLRGTRRAAAREFFVDALTTVIADDEILTEIEFPVSAAGSIFAFREFSRRHGDFAIASCAIVRNPAERRLVIGFGGIGTVPFFSGELSEALAMGGHDLEAAADLISREIDRIELIGDLNASPDYRRHLAAKLSEECIREVFGHA